MGERAIDLALLAVSGAGDDGVDGTVALRGLALRLGLSYADGLSLMDYLGDNAANMDWFVDVVRWVAGAQVDGQGEYYVGLGVEVC